MTNACQELLFLLPLQLLFTIIIIVDFKKKSIPEMMMVITLLRLKEVIQPNDLSFWSASSVHRLSLQNSPGAWNSADQLLLHLLILSKKIEQLMN